MLAAPPGGPASWSALAHYFPDIPQEGVAIDHRGLTVLHYPLLADDALGIDEKEYPVGEKEFVIEDCGATRELRFGKVAEQRVRQLQRFGERLLREGQIGTDAENLDAKSFEPFVVGLPGRQVCRSRGCEVRSV